MIWSLNRWILFVLLYLNTCILEHKNASVQWSEKSVEWQVIIIWMNLYLYNYLVFIYIFILGTISNLKYRQHLYSLNHGLLREEPVFLSMRRKHCSQQQVIHSIWKAKNVNNRCWFIFQTKVYNLLIVHVTLKANLITHSVEQIQCVSRDWVGYYSPDWPGCSGNHGYSSPGSQPMAEKHQ